MKMGPASSRYLVPIPPGRLGSICLAGTAIIVRIQKCPGESGVHVHPANAIPLHQCGSHGGKFVGVAVLEGEPARLLPAKFLFVLQDCVRRQYREGRSSNEYEETPPSVVEPACPRKDSGKGDENCRAETRFESVRHGPPPRAATGRAMNLSRFNRISAVFEQRSGASYLKPVEALWISEGRSVNCGRLGLLPANVHPLFLA